MSEKKQTNKNMAFCQACGKEIAKSAKTCPHCGAKQKKPIYKKWWFWVLIVIIIGIAAPKGDTKTNDATDDSPEDQKQETPVVVEGSKEKPYSIDTVATVGDIDWKIISAEDIGTVIPSGNTFIDDCKTNSGTYLKIVVSVKNNRTDMFTITDLPIYDDLDREFITSSDVSMCVEDDIYILENINPGIEKTFVAIYEVPTDSKGFMLEVDSTGGITSRETNKYISLGF